MTIPNVPSYEGHPVAKTAIKMSGAIPMEDLEGAIIGIDDIVQLIAQFKCVGVHHVTDKDGEITRVQVLRPMLMIPSPLDPEDESGEFISRKLPRPIQGSAVTNIANVTSLPSSEVDDEDDD